MRTQELEEILVEEAEAVEGDKDQPQPDLVRNLHSAAHKISLGISPLTQDEIDAVKHALQDIGELYLFAGTSAGFDNEDPDTDAANARKGRQARWQASRLGIRV